MDRTLHIHHIMVLHRCFQQYYKNQYPLEIVQVIIKWFCILPFQSIKCDEVDFGQIIVHEFNEEESNCFIAKILYATPFMEDKLFISTNAFTLNGGIYYDETDDLHCRIKIIFGGNQPTLSDFEQHLTEADNYFCSDIVKERLFGNNIHDYFYCGFIQHDPYTKNKEYYCCPRLSLGLGEDSTIIRLNGKKLNGINSMSDLRKIINYKCKISICFSYERVWITKYLFHLSTHYGVSLVIKEINKIDNRSYIGLSNSKFALS
jgi:hypothetical protein